MLHEGGTKSGSQWPKHEICVLAGYWGWGQNLEGPHQMLNTIATLVSVEKNSLEPAFCSQKPGKFWWDSGKAVVRTHEECCAEI